MSEQFGQHVIDQIDEETVEGSWSYNGEEYDLEVRDIAKGDLDRIQKYAQLTDAQAEGEEISEEDVEEIGNFSWEDEDSDEDWLNTVLRSKLESPEIGDPDDQPIRLLMSLFQGMMEAWTDPGDVAEAREDMPLDEGNR